MQAEKRNVLTLAACQALFQTASVLIMTVGGLAGQMLAADKSLATLPIASMSVGTALATIPASLIMQRVGRRGGFMIGTLQVARALTDRDLSDQLLARGVETALRLLDDWA